MVVVTSRAQSTVISAVGAGWPIPPAEFPHPWRLCVGSVGSRGSLLRRAPGAAPQETTAAARTTGTGSFIAGTDAFLSFEFSS